MLRRVVSRSRFDRHFPLHPEPIALALPWLGWINQREVEVRQELRLLESVMCRCEKSGRRNKIRQRQKNKCAAQGTNLEDAVVQLHPGDALAEAGILPISPDKSPAPLHLLQLVAASFEPSLPRKDHAIFTINLFTPLNSSSTLGRCQRLLERMSH